MSSDESRTPRSGDDDNWYVREVERLREEVQQMRQENQRLRQERRMLLRENRVLRREATLARLYDEVTKGEKRSEPPKPEPPAPEGARTLFSRLPNAFRFPEFFELTSELGVEADQARRYLLFYLRSNMLTQTGSQLEKSSEYRSNNPVSNTGS